jgi:hypothetical protein
VVIKISSESNDDCQFYEFRRLKKKSSDSNPSLRAVSSVAIYRNQEQEKYRDRIDYIPEAADESVIYTNDNSYRKETYCYPLGLLDIKGFLPEIVQAVTCAVYIQKAYGTN